MGLTKGDVNEGDRVKDSLGFYYEIVSRNPMTWGTTFGWYECGLKEIFDVDIRIPTSGSTPTSDPSFFGFESKEAGVTEFEDGFERGYFV